jgi:hypothetical protein
MYQAEKYSMLASWVVVVGDGAEAEIGVADLTYTTSLK